MSNETPATSTEARQAIKDAVDAHFDLDDPRLAYVRVNDGAPDPETGEQDYRWERNPESDDVWREREAQLDAALDAYAEIIARESRRAVVAEYQPVIAQLVAALRPFADEWTDAQHMKHKGESVDLDVQNARTALARAE